MEDDEISQKIICEILYSDGFEVEVAPDGIIALMQIAKGKFDLILSDIGMPNFDGYQLLEYLNENNIKLPVVFLSSYISKEEVLKGLQMGALDYIKKPIDREMLLVRLNNLLKM